MIASNTIRPFYPMQLQNGTPQTSYTAYNEPREGCP
jgi:hypothetical protein